MEDVARRAGVSQMTVSRALRTPDKVAPGTRARIAAAVAELDYVPDMVAGGLAAKRSRLVAVIVSTLENSIFAATVEGLSSVLREDGYAVLLGASGYSRETEEESDLEQHSAGVPMAWSDRRPAHAGRTAFAAGERDPGDRNLGAARGAPRSGGGVSNREAGAAMVRTLHDCGYRRIAFIGTAAEDDRRGRLRREGDRPRWPNSARVRRAARPP